jgi:hypothetical protein
MCKQGNIPDRSQMMDLDDGTPEMQSQIVPQNSSAGNCGSGGFMKMSVGKERINH